MPDRTRDPERRRVKQRGYQFAAYQRNPEHKRRLKRESMERTRPQLNARKRAEYQANREAICLSQQERRRRYRLEAFNAYGGPICRCCGEDTVEFLTFDHVDGGGNAHRRVIGQGSIVHWLRRENYPPGFQVLCYNCNNAKAYHGGCPHELKIDEAVSSAA